MDIPLFQAMVSANTGLTPKTYQLPDTLAAWPWGRSINPHYAKCKRESSEWARSFRAFSPKAQAAFDKCDFNLLAALAYPKLSEDGCRVACDLMNLFFIFDEWSDVSDGAETRRQADAIMDALRHPERPRPSGEWIGGEVTRQFWLNAIKTATEATRTRFVETFDIYTQAVVQQSLDRSNSHIRSIPSYFAIRRGTIGIIPSLVINTLHYNLTDDVLNHSIIKQLEVLCLDMIIIANDIYSYNVEQSRGDDGHNLVTVVAKEFGFELQQALDWIANLHDDLASQFITAYNDLTLHFKGEDGKVNLEALAYADDMGNWVRANDQWSFESERYFGKDGPRIMNSKNVTLLPKQQ